MTSTNSRRRLAFVFHPRSFSSFAVARSARALCELQWVVDTSVPEVELMVRLLARLGGVVDVAGMSIEEAAVSIAATQPDGILALRDSQLPWTARVAELLQLPFVAPAVAERLSDKYVQRGALRSAGLAVPGFWLVADEADTQARSTLGAQARFPLLLKPRRGAGSRDVVAVASIDELEARLAEICDGPDAQRSQLYLEEFLPDRAPDEGQDFGGYVSVESIVSSAGVSHIAITGRFPTSEPFRESGFFIPSALDADECDGVLELARAAIAALGVTLGCLHTEIKLTPDGPRVIEVNGRIGGGTPEMLAAVSDIDMLAIAMRLALGDPIAFAEMPSCTGVVYVLYAHAPPAMRRVIAIEGLEALRGDPQIDQVIINRGPGQSVHWREGNWGHVFAVHGRASDHEQLKLLARRVRSETDIHGE